MKNEIKKNWIIFFVLSFYEFIPSAICFGFLFDWIELKVICTLIYGSNFARHFGLRFYFRHRVLIYYSFRRYAR